MFGFSCVVPEYMKTFSDFILLLWVQLLDTRTIQPDNSSVTRPNKGERKRQNDRKNHSFRRLWCSSTTECIVFTFHRQISFASAVFIVKTFFFAQKFTCCLAHHVLGHVKYLEFCLFFFRWGLLNANCLLQTN